MNNQEYHRKYLSLCIRYDCYNACMGSIYGNYLYLYLQESLMISSLVQLLVADERDRFDSARLLIVTGFGVRREPMPYALCFIRGRYRKPIVNRYAVYAGVGRCGAAHLSCICNERLRLHTTMHAETAWYHSHLLERARCRSSRALLLTLVTEERRGRYQLYLFFYFRRSLPFHRKLCAGGILLHACVIDTYLLAALIARVLKHPPWNFARRIGR